MAGVVMRKRSRPAVIDPMVVEVLLVEDTNALPSMIRQMIHNQHRTSKSRNPIHTVLILSSLTILLLNAMTIQIAQSFTFHRDGIHIFNQRSKVANHFLPSSLYGVIAPTTNRNIDEDSNTKSDSNIDAQRYKEEAAKIRLEAERMDLELVILKMQTIQKSIDKLIKKQNQLIDTSSGRSNNTKANLIRESIEQLEEQIRTLQKKIGTTGKDIENAASILEVPDETTTLDLYNSGNVSNGTFVATATTMGKSDVVPLVVVIDPTADTIVFTASGSVLTTTTTSTRDTTISSSATSTITRPSSRINVVPKTTTTLLPRKSSVPALSEATTEVTKQHRSNHDTDDDNNNINISTATIYGYDKADLDLYLPVALEIEATMSNATAEERLEKFRTSPLLQTNFQTKLTQMFVEPIQEMNRIQELKQEYLDSTSSKEKELLKRQIDTISKTLDLDGPFLYSESVYRPTPAITADDINERVTAMQTLPEILQTIYKQRYNLDSTANLTLAILLDHYEIQLQLLEQIKLLRQPFTPEVREQIVQAIESLPIIVQNHVASILGLKPEEYSIDDLILELSKDDDETDEEEDWWDQLFDTASIQSKSSASKSSPLSAINWSVLGDVSTLDEEGNDIEMIDRSRYVYNFYPAIARMEQQVIAYDTVDQISKVLFNAKKSFMVTNKLERVVGGYYIRGRNLLDEDQSGIKLMEHIQRTLSTTNVTFDEEFEYFYLRDPAPLTDEEIELEYRNDPVFAITGKNVTLFYDNSTPLTKAMVTFAAFISMGLMAIDNYHMEPILQNQLESYVGLASVTTTNDIELATILSNLCHVMIPLTILQLVHEMGHRIIAWKDKFNVGIPTFIPSIQLGCLGTITPLTSPPPSLKSIFDFGMSGPLFGLLGSFVLLAVGLQSTSWMDMNQLASQPSIPTNLLRSSTLGGAFIEWFLGPGSLVPDVTSPLLPLHPLAIAGYIGMISNALALLPLGNTDGGRIAISMFGRRGSLVVRTLVAAMLCSAGLFGQDDSGILLNYIVVVILWQDEIETPARNEVEELDFGRGCFGIAMAALVFMILLPMQS